MNTIVKDNSSSDKVQQLKIKFRIELSGLSVKKLSKIHRRTERRIYDALTGEAPQLLLKIIKTIERYEKKNQTTESIN